MSFALLNPSWDSYDPSVGGGGALPFGGGRYVVMPVDGDISDPVMPVYVRTDPAIVSAKDTGAIVKTITNSGAGAGADSNAAANAVATAPELIPGISNTTLVLAGAVLLVVLIAR